MRRQRWWFQHSRLTFAALVALAGSAASVEAQEGRITGRVTDASSGAPISEVQVYVVGSQVGALSRQDGRFLILNVPAGTHEVRAERIGYAALSQEVTVSGGGTVDVVFALESQALGLDEIVVTGTAGASRRREVGNSIAQLDIAELPDRPAQVTDMLQSAAPGIAVTGVGGGIGNGKRIVLRGNSSVSMSNQPIIYVDGVRMMSGAFPQTTAREYRPGRGANVTASPLDNINPNDIERIEVIKGSAATTLYGTEASAGVIQIFTKKGAVGAPVWNAEIQQGLGWTPKWGVEPEPYMRMDPYIETAYAQNYLLSVRGGGQNLQYFISGQLDDETGILPNDQLEKYVVRGNFTVAPREDLQVQWNTTYANQWQKNTPEGNNSQGITLNAFRGERNYFASEDPELLKVVFDYDLQQRIERLTTGGTVTYTPFSNLTNRITVGYDFSQQEARNLRPYGFPMFPQGALQNNVWQKRLLTFDYVSSFAFDLTDALSSNLSWGGQAVGDEIREVEVWGENFPGAAEPTVSSASIKIGEESREKVWTAGFFVQNVLDISDRYFFTAGVRVDGNSAFGEGFGLQVYPKASLSWVLSDESFWNESWGQVKLRAAYGQSGRAPGAFDAVRTWSAPGLGGRPAFVPENVGNPDLGPEVTSETELGFDASWLDGRLNSTFTFYHQQTNDALFPVSQVPSEGFGGQDQLLNIGKVRNQGIELSLDAAVINRERWGWDVGMNLSTNHSKVLDLGGANEFQALGGWIIKGQPVPVIRDYYVANPDEIGDPVIEADHLYGPQLPTHTVSGTTTVRVPGGVLLSARGEYRGGNRLEINPMSVERGVRSPLCYPYYETPETSNALQDGIPAIWRARCTPNLVRGGFYLWDGDYFKLRSVTATIPVDFAFPDQIDSSVLTLSLNNAYTWMRESPWGDPELLSNEGANSAGLGQTERMPTPITFRAALRLTF